MASHAEPVALLYAYRKDVLGNPGPLRLAYEARHSGLTYHVTNNNTLLYELMQLRQSGADVRLAVEGELTKDVLPAKAVPVFPFPAEFVAQLPLDELLSPVKGDTRPFPTKS